MSSHGTTLQVSGINSITIKNVAVGEVWLASGQSNMEFRLRQASDGPEAIAASTDPLLRSFNVGKAVAETPLKDVKGAWQIAGPDSSPMFSAVGYFFALALRQKLDVPVGLIHASWGGTEAEAWTSLPALQAEAEFKPIFDRWDKYLVAFPASDERYKNEVLPQWEAERQKAKAENRPEPARPREPIGPTSPHRPANLYNGMIAPLVPYAIRGAIWYQGESNASRAYQYRHLLPTMIQDWRTAWGVKDPQNYPFYMVQLANFRAEKPEPGESEWAELREAQTMTALMPGNDQALAIDIGDGNDIHPTNKREVGNRLALCRIGANLRAKY